MTDEEATEQVQAEAESEADGATDAAGADADAPDAATEEGTVGEETEVGDPDAETDAADADVADSLGPRSTSLVAKVALEDDSLADDLEAHLADLETEKREAEERAEDLEAKLKRNRADFQNYKKRAKKRQEQMQARAAEDLVERLLDVRDNLVRALDAEHDDVESVREGVEMTLKELDRVFEDENVSEIDPEPGAETDPQRHEVMMRVESDRPEGTVADVYQPGYEMGEKVLRAAQVTVSDGDSE